MDHKQIFLTGVTLIALGFQISAHSAPIEALVMPGPVSEAHADIETECADCHAAFSKTLQRDLCLSCHEHKSILEDQAAGTGFHGRFEAARNAECSSCHTEHEGREADIVRLDRESFDHGFTDFTLSGAHAQAGCEDCHADGKLFREAPSTCFSCHREDDSHLGRLGEDCSSCHHETTWRETSFDHAKDTDFTLTGAHQDVKCALCHSNEVYKGVPADCYSCHQIDDYHKGDFGKDCKQCHSTGQWKETSFDHARASNFALEGKHREISCGSCHEGSLFDLPLKSECSACHSLDDVHQGGNGDDCASCHDSRGWTGSTFDHQKDTDFPLRGAHEKLECRACHTGRTPGLKIDTACFSCHQVADAHQGVLGEDCAACHKETGWTDEVRFDHDLSSFPLIGLHAVAPCEACHLSPRFTDAKGSCFDCHGQDDPHENSLGKDCGTCHNPNDWKLWEFDHDASTGFLLDGAHSELACQSCHTQGSNYKARLDTNCIACHRSDDIHAGQFGKQCSRCHDSGSFAVSGTMQ